MRLYLTALKPTDSVTDGFLPAARALGCSVTILTDRPEQHPDAVRCDVRDPRALIDAIEHLGRPDAVFSNSDHLQTETALAAAYFGLPGKDWRACAAAKNKFLMRRALAAAGVEEVFSLRLGPGDPVPERVPYPVVVKPREGVASEDVILVTDDLAAAVAGVRRRRPGEALVVEEYLEGPVRTLETLGDEGGPRVLGGFETTLGGRCRTSWKSGSTGRRRTRPTRTCWPRCGRWAWGSGRATPSTCSPPRDRGSSR
ncbi:hypothetical protein [Nonomuraea salmonea]|uniref:ATP-grasp domain-containing protein n=1 Tax=Nonomuraea salmonea TaxID=46181 RepID=UPI002FE7A986